MRKCERKAGNGRSQTILLILSRIETMWRRRGVFASSSISQHLEANGANTMSKFLAFIATASLII